MTPAALLLGQNCTTSAGLEATDGWGEHQSSGNRNTKATILNLICFTSCLFSGCVGEAVVLLFVDLPLDSGDLFLLGGLEA